MRLPFAILMLTVAFGATAAATDASRNVCAERKKIVAHLEKKYGETRRGAGLQDKGSVTELYASAKTGTWTILVTRPDGVSCAVAAGEAWLEDLALEGAPA